MTESNCNNGIWALSHWESALFFALRQDCAAIILPRKTAKNGTDLPEKTEQAGHPNVIS